MENDGLVELTAEIAAAYVTNNKVAAGTVGELVQEIHRALASLGEEPEEQSQPVEPAVPVRSSIKPDYLVCLACGAKQKTLKRHLASSHNMSPNEYRERFNLRPDYPMTSPDYSQRRSDMAKAAGLGAKKGETRRLGTSNKGSK